MMILTRRELGCLLIGFAASTQSQTLSPASSAASFEFNPWMAATAGMAIALIVVVILARHGKLGKASATVTNLADTAKIDAEATIAALGGALSKAHGAIATLSSHIVALKPAASQPESPTASPVAGAEAKPSSAKSAMRSQPQELTMSGITTVIPQETVDWMRTVVTANPPAEPATAVPGTPAASAWPHMITIDGINIMADADINPAWKATLMSKIIAGSYAGPNGSALTDHYVADPSNGKKAGQPVRSPAGFPLFYAIAGNGAIIGTPSILYAELSFNSDSEVMEYIARTTAAA